jgi:hypothetical protein
MRSISWSIAAGILPALIFILDTLNGFFEVPNIDCSRRIQIPPKSPRPPSNI